MSKYTDIDVKTLTVDDALRDTDWNKQPMDYVRYVTIEMPILQSIAEDFTSDETRRFMQVLALYFINGIEPDYHTIQSTAVKQAVRITITAQTERIESVYLTHYKQYVSAIQRREKQEANKGT
jgi:hypothetical protein